MPASRPRPPSKATDELIDFAEHSLAGGLFKGDVKRLLAARYKKNHPDGTISPRTLETIISAARKRILAAVGRDRDELRAESMAFYESMARSGDAAPRDRIKARESIDRLLGLCAPLKHEVAATVATSPADLSKLTDAELVAYRAMLAKMTPVPATSP